MDKGFVNCVVYEDLVVLFGLIVFGLIILKTGGEIMGGLGFLGFFGCIINVFVFLDVV